jgi:hypothetical protein
MPTKTNDAVRILQVGDVHKYAYWDHAIGHMRSLTNDTVAVM